MTTQTDAAPQRAVRLPEYAVEMKHFHCAFATELKAVVDSLPLAPEKHVIDIGCGDGFYLELFASRLGERGSVTGLDCNQAYLDVARERLGAREWLCRVQFLQGNLDHASLTGDRFDVVWCAQSLFSLPDPSRALQSMARLVRPGGFVAVLENDSLHQALLPWPPALELAVRAAQFQALSEQRSSPENFYVARDLPVLFAAAGLQTLNFEVQSCTRRGPFGEHFSAFLKSYLGRLARQVQRSLDAKWREDLARFADPQGDSYVLDQQTATITWLNTIAWGQKPL